MNDRSHLMTELRLPESMELDAMPIADAVALMNAQDARAVEAVGKERDAIARAVEIVVAALRAKTIFLTCVQPVPDEPTVDVVILPITGPEVVTGSTRLKAGTATKLVLNTISTLAMVQLGKVYGNLMVDLRATNAKLHDRGA